MNTQIQRSLIQKHETTPYSYGKLVERLDKLLQRITQQLHFQKVQPFIQIKMDSKKKQIAAQICNQAIQQTSTVLQRQIRQQLENFKIKQKLQKFDYLMSRKQILTDMGTDPNKIYDPEEAYLDNVISYLQKYKQKISQESIEQKDFQFQI